MTAQVNRPKARFRGPGALRRKGRQATVEADSLVDAALLGEARIGRRIAGRARHWAMVAIGGLVVALNPSLNWDLLYFETIVVLFWISGRVQMRLPESAPRVWLALLISVDIAVLCALAVLPNPLSPWVHPAGYGLRWEPFLYFFLLLALVTLAHDWRIVWRTGVGIAVFWVVSVALAQRFGPQVPQVTETALSLGMALQDPDIVPFVDLNNVQWRLRLQEVVLIVIVAAALSLKGWRTNQLVARQALIAAERANLTRYFPPTMVDRLASQPAALSQPKAQAVAVMFTDLVGFTERAEVLPDAEVLPILRRYYAAVEKVVFDHDGTLDKYLGDGVMATFGTPLPAPDDAANALRAARAVVAAVDALGTGLSVSVGVHFGQAVVGDVGPARRLEYAVIGDTVNVASRLETLTRTLDVRIVVSQALVDRARQGGATEADLQGFSSLPGQVLRGRQSAIDTWVWGRTDSPAS